MTYLGTVGHLLLHLNHRIEHRCLSVEYQTVGICYVRLHLLGHIVVGKYGGVDASVLHRIVACDYVWRHITAQATSALYHRTASHAHSRIGYDVGREYHVVLYLAVSGNLRAVSEHAIVRYLGVVRHVHALHKEVMIAYDGLSVTEGGTVYHHVLAYAVIVSDNQHRVVSAEVEVLRLRSVHRVLEYLVATSYACALHHTDVRIDNAVVSNLDVVLYVGERINGDVLSYSRLGVYFCFWTDHILFVFVFI